MMAASDIAATQALTFAIPLGFFAVVLLWGFFQRRSTRCARGSPRNGLAQSPSRYDGGASWERRSSAS